MQRILPAYPLFTKDPFFSVWLPCDTLNGCDTEFWQTDKKPIKGYIIADDRKYCFMGKHSDDSIKLKQTALNVGLFNCSFSFMCDDFDLTVDFISPLPLDNIELLASPVCYFTYKLEPKRLINSVRVFLSVDGEMCSNPSEKNLHRKLRGDVMRFRDFETAYFGLDKQQILSFSADTVGADWGYYYLTGDKAFYHTESEFEKVFTVADLPKEIPAGKQYITAVNLHDCVTEEINGKILFSFDDICSIYYYGEMLKGYYFRNGKNIINAINEGYYGFSTIQRELAVFEDKFNELIRPYGEDYYKVCVAAYRQTIAAHKLVMDKNGRLLFLSKECGSGGCIATVDVTYPSMPLFLLYNPSLLEGMLHPIFDFAQMPIWEYDFAPHDAGLYPYCFGQYYAALRSDNGKYNRQLHRQGSEGVLNRYYLYPKESELYDHAKQMPVEESANMLIIVALLYRANGNRSLIDDNFSLLEKWAKYLVNEGLMPKNQLCTDDFAGVIDKNVNLSIKSIEAIYAFSHILKIKGDYEESKKFASLARARVKELKELYPNTMPLSFDDKGESFSLKYNLTIDLLWEEGIFDTKTMENEVDLYLSKANKFGCPLDYREAYTKSDWLMWTAALTQDIAKRNTIISQLAVFLTESPSRVAYSDWYNSTTGEIYPFKNRTVQGALFILPLIDKLKLTGK